MDPKFQFSLNELCTTVNFLGEKANGRNGIKQSPVISKFSIKKDIILLEKTIHHVDCNLLIAYRNSKTQSEQNRWGMACLFDIFNDDQEAVDFCNRYIVMKWFLSSLSLCRDSTMENCYRMEYYVFVNTPTGINSEQYPYDIRDLYIRECNNTAFMEKVGEK